MNMWLFLHTSIEVHPWCMC